MFGSVCTIVLSILLTSLLHNEFHIRRPFDDATNMHTAMHRTQIVRKINKRIVLAIAFAFVQYSRHIGERIIDEDNAVTYEGFEWVWSKYGKRE